MSSSNSIPFEPQVSEALKRAATKRGSGLTRVDRAALPLLAEAFQTNSVLPLARLLTQLWPRSERRNSLNRFHQLKRRFNNARVGVVLCSPSDNRDPEKKEVWFEADQSPLERVTSEVRSSPEPDKPFYDPALYYPTVQGRTQSPLLTFPDELTRFGENHLADSWAALSEPAKELLCTLSTRFMPIVQIYPQEADNPVRGFELLACGARGELYGALLKRCREYDLPLDLLDTFLLLVQVLSVLELRSRMPVSAKLPAFFSLNLSPPLLADGARLARAVISRFDKKQRELLLFELTEKIRQPQLEPLKLLLAEFEDLQVGLDDVNDHHLLTAAHLGQYACFTKLSHEYVQAVLRRMPEAPEEFLKALLIHALPRKPLVLEGIEDMALVLALFQDMRAKEAISEGVLVYAQGFGCVLDADWKPYLHIPPGMGWRGQFALPPSGWTSRADASEERASRGLWRHDAGEYFKTRGQGERQSTAPILDLIMAWANEPAVPIAYLLGETGSGKTFTTRMFVRSLREMGRAHGSRSRVPLYIDIREVPEAIARSGTLKEILRSGATHLRLPEEDWDHVLEALSAGRMLLVLDGIDEKAAHLAEKGAIQRFRRILHSAAVDAAKILIVSRHTVHPDEETMNREIRGDEIGGPPLDAGADARILEILPLPRQDFEPFLTHYLPAGDAAALSDQLAQVHDLADLGSRACLLRLLAERRHEVDRELRTRGKPGGAVLYETMVREWLARDEEKSILVSDIKTAVMEQLATEMWQAGLDSISPGDLRRNVISEVNRFYGGTPPIDPARTGLEDIRAAAFLTRDEEGACLFVHRSFQEFFLGRRLASGITQGDPDALEGPPLPREAIGFLASLVSRKTLLEVLTRDLTTGGSKRAARRRNAELIQQYLSAVES